MKRAELYSLRAAKYREQGYKLIHFAEYDFTQLSGIMYGKRSGRGSKHTVNDCIIMADTETSKGENTEDNHIVCWTISIRAYGMNIVTLWGNKPSDMISTMTRIHHAMAGDDTIIYFHNLSYDYVFLRKFMFQAWNYPDHQLNTKPHYPIYIHFENGLIIKDSLILAQRSLEKWADDMDVEHKKAVGKWNYNKMRDQDFKPDDEELEYIEHDTLAGVECIDRLRLQLVKQIWNMPYTATGIPREKVRKLGAEEKAHDRFLAMVADYPTYCKEELTYHGGFCHANRHEIGFINNAICYDFASSYPYCLISEKYPAERFNKIADCEIDDILKMADDYAFMFKLVLVRPKLKNDNIVMPALQLSKCVKTINAITDNGRILFAEYAEIYLTEQDLKVISDQYTYVYGKCIDVHAAVKDYLPRWLTDYIYSLFKEKTMLKGGDPVLYALKKAELNSIYGLHCQKSVREDIQENYTSGEFDVISSDLEEKYNKYINSYKSVLPYQWGVWCTAYAFRNIFELGKCIDTANGGLWLYTDTDSCYATAWDTEAVERYNEACKEKLTARGYGAVNFNGRDYWLGVAELDGNYSEFMAQGAKRYACRDAGTGELKITVAGVPKKTGAKCLNGDINNFRPGMIFDGSTTGKLLHKYIFIDDIYIDSKGNEVGDSVDLSPCDYLLSSINTVNWADIEEKEIELQIYD